MDSSKIAIKWYAQPSSDLRAKELVPVFHQWIQKHMVPEHVLIDVADYDHVPSGPGVVLVSHEANFAYDLGDGHPGLLYTRLRPLGGTFGQKLAAACAASLAACARLEEFFTGRLQFSMNEVLVRINDRLHAPSTQATLLELNPELDRFFASLLGGNVTLTQKLDPHRPFEVSVTAPAANGSVADLLARLK